MEEGQAGLPITLSPLQTSTNAHRYWSLAAQDSAASTQWAPTPVRGTHWSAAVVTMLTRRALNVWVRLEPLHLPLCPRGSVEGPSGLQGVLLACPTDVNECETGVHRCGEGQLCHNLPGSYRCDCKPGFQRDAFGRTCIGKRYWGLGSPGNNESAPLYQLSGLDLSRRPVFKLPTLLLVKIPFYSPLTALSSCASVSSGTFPAGWLPTLCLLLIFSPADVNECWVSPGRLCQHTCENTPGSYRCSCAAGFLLAADGKHCEGTGYPDF